MKKIKVIDLLNKISNGEEVPEIIKYEGNYYKFIERNEGTYNYKCIDYSTKKLCDSYIEDDFFLTNILNREIEIIEDTSKEDKKIEKLGAFNIKKFYDDYPETANFILEMFKKQEELIDKVNGE